MKSINSKNNKSNKSRSVLVGYRNWVNNKRYLSANGSSLLPLALRPRLFLVAVFLVFGIVLLFNSNSVFAASITLTLPTEGINVDLKPTNEGAYGKSNNTNISVATEAAFGYTLTIAAKNEDNSNDLVNGTNKLTSIASELTEEEYKSEGNLNTWAFIPSKLYNAESNTTSNNDKLQPGPTTSPVTIDKTNASNAVANDYALAIAAKVDKTIPSGEYSNTFVITAMANSVAYTINYNLNSGIGVSTPEKGTTMESTVAISSTTPTRSGYNFKGWCNQSTTTASCSGTTYQPGRALTLSVTGNNTFNLWAMWESALPSPCSSGTVRLADGKYWCKTDASSSANWETAKSICNQGNYHLPSQAEFNALIRAYYPSATSNGTSYSYYFNNDASTFTSAWGATSGNWWSSTDYLLTYAYGLYLYSSGINSRNTYDKPYNYQVRCVSS